MCFGGSKTVAIPEAPKRNYEMDQEFINSAAARERQRQKQAQGRQSTILTNFGTDTPSATGGNKTMLGE